MLRINSDNRNIKSIKRYYSIGDPPIQMECDVDSFVLIPGVTLYNGIYSSNGNCLNFVEKGQMGNTLVVEFNSNGDLERFFTQMLRDIKLNQIMGINIETDK